MTQIESDKLSSKNIELIDITNIHPYENNPRKNHGAVEAVKNSIERYGFINPIVIDVNNIIVAGHTRYQAALELGLKIIPTIKVDNLTEEKVKEFRLADNKTSELSIWDVEKLESELKDISYDMSNFGFDSIMLDSLDKMFDLDEVDDLTEESYSPPDSECQCPKCGHIDYKRHFKKVTSEVKARNLEIEKESFDDYE